MGSSTPVATCCRTARTVCSSGLDGAGWPLGGHGRCSSDVGTFMHHSPRHSDSDSSSRFVWSLQGSFRVSVSSVPAKS